MGFLVPRVVICPFMSKNDDTVFVFLVCSAILVTLSVRNDVFELKMVHRAVGLPHALILYSKYFKLCLRLYILLSMVLFEEVYYLNCLFYLLG